MNKQETVEQAAENYAIQIPISKYKISKEAFIKGIKWHAERSISIEAYEDTLNMQTCSNAGYESKIAELESTMYSEEEVLDIIDNFNSSTQDEKSSIKKWFENHRK